MPTIKVEVFSTLFVPKLDSLSFYRLHIKERIDVE
jgi:hypothetical protein